MGIAGALLILTVWSGGHASVSVVAAVDMDDCQRVREPLALTFARKDQYAMSSIPNVWKTRDGQVLNGSVTLECKPV